MFQFQILSTARTGGLLAADPSALPFLASGPVNPFEPALQKIPLHGQLTNLGVECFHVLIAARNRLVPRRHRSGIFRQLCLPVLNLSPRRAANATLALNSGEWFLLVFS